MAVTDKPSGIRNTSDTSMPPAIRVEGLTHSYHTAATSAQILDTVSFELAKGETVALIGRSGSGKSTLLNLISGLEPIVTGDAQLGGVSMKSMSDHDRTLLRGKHIGFIYQSFNLIPTLSVHDNIALPLALAGIETQKQKSRIYSLLESIGLAGRDQQYPDRLSGGEQQRVAIARALVHEPPLILADEPTGNLDANSGRQVMQLLSTLVQQQDSAMLLVTHSMEVARGADRVLMLEQSRLRQVPPDLLEQSAIW